ncbi:MAG: zinc-ribbon domain-containing protein [Gammaproteobacteria bacterium]|nr:zinc-ribbon domain-containing protein [Gammaproteobacteria bacterium]
MICMRRLECPNCGQRVFFENFRCIACGREFGFDPVELRMALLDPDRIACAQRRGPVSCNWLLARGEPGPLCRSCRLTRTLPDLSAQDPRSACA